MLNLRCFIKNLLKTIEIENIENSVQFTFILRTIENMVMHVIQLNGSTSGCVNSANTSRTQALLEENVCKLEKVKEQQANEIIVLKTKLLEAERKLRENKEVIQQKTERESR